MSIPEIFLALGVPGGQYLMPDGTTEYQVLYGGDTWGLSHEEYSLWNTIRQTPYAATPARTLAQRLAREGALYLYHETPDEAFLLHHRIAPMGRPIGPLPQDPQHFLILSTNAQHQVICDIATAQVWLSWWRGRPLSQTDDFSLSLIWQTIPWALHHALGYLTLFNGDDAG
jgi:hypothetical protein